MTARTLTGLLNARAAARPAAVPVIVPGLGDGPDNPVTYEIIRRRAVTIAAWLSAAARPGDRVLLAYPPGAEFLGALFGAMSAGVVPVPVPPPLPGPMAARYRQIADDCGPVAALTCTAWRDDPGLFLRFPVPPVTATDTMPGRPGSRLADPGDPSAVAYIQYTSGTTGTPKGVMITHGNVLAGTEITARRARLTPQTLGASWLPLWHDMGLAEPILAMHAGCGLILSGPEQFIMNPAAWIADAAARGATTLAMPTLAYDILARLPAADRENLNLAAVVSAAFGADVACPAALDAFAGAFAGSGLDPAALHPAYGMAEVVGMAAAGHPGQGHAVYTASPDALRKGLLARSPSGIPLSVSGQPLPGVETGIWRDGSPGLCPPGVIGQILLRGPSVATRYWPARDPRVTAAGHRWTPTGDLGALTPAGDLIVLGRSADLIVTPDGDWHFPALLERTASDAGAGHGIRSHACAAFEHDGGIVIAARAPGRAGDDATAAIRDAVDRAHGVKTRVVLSAGRLPAATTSGKLRRHAVRRALKDGELRPRQPGTPDLWHPAGLQPADSA